LLSPRPQLLQQAAEQQLTQQLPTAQQWPTPQQHQLQQPQQSMLLPRQLSVESERLHPTQTQKQSSQHEQETEHRLLLPPPPPQQQEEGQEGFQQRQQQQQEVQADTSTSPGAVVPKAGAAIVAVTVMYLQLPDGSVQPYQQMPDVSLKPFKSSGQVPSQDKQELRQQQQGQMYDGLLQPDQAAKPQVHTSLQQPQHSQQNQQEQWLEPRQQLQQQHQLQPGEWQHCQHAMLVQQEPLQLASQAHEQQRSQQQQQQRQMQLLQLPFEPPGLEPAGISWQQQQQQQQLSWQQQQFIAGSVATPQTQLVPVGTSFQQQPLQQQQAQAVVLLAPEGQAVFKPQTQQLLLSQHTQQPELLQSCNHHHQQQVGVLCADYVGSKSVTTMMQQHQEPQYSMLMMQQQQLHPTGLSYAAGSLEQSFSSRALLGSGHNMALTVSMLPQGNVPLLHASQQVPVVQQQFAPTDVRHNAGSNIESYFSGSSAGIISGLQLQQGSNYVQF
jgi:hypothetical protein